MGEGGEDGILRLPLVWMWHPEACRMSKEPIAMCPAITLRQCGRCALLPSMPSRLPWGPLCIIMKDSPCYPTCLLMITPHASVFFGMAMKRCVKLILLRWYSGSVEASE